jgi:oligoribonuclease NrnB/cAMP/cGMP phosphodiesterase (DHH superfamily)
LAGNAIVISHRKDADGISSAALVRYMTGAKVYLTDYGDAVETLSSVGKADEYYICDLGTNQNTFPGFLEQLRRLSGNGKVFYTDHHPISEEYSSKIRELGIDVNHSTEECASVLVFKKYEQAFKDSPQMKIVACCGAITDYMDSRPYAKKLISSFDRQFLLYEATVLSFTIAMIGRGSKQSNAKLVKLSQELAKEKLPHEIKRASVLAQAHARRSAALVKLAKKKGQKMKNFAYMFTKESSTGNVANFLIGAFDVLVGVALREEEPGYYEISLRSSDESSKDLGKIISKISFDLGTSGGGHPHASGARIKKSQFEKFVSLLDEALSAN